jgi:hypothetical protein
VQDICKEHSLIAQAIIYPFVLAFFAFNASSPSSVDSFWSCTVVALTPTFADVRISKSVKNVSIVSRATSVGICSTLCTSTRGGGTVVDCESMETKKEDKRRKSCSGGWQRPGHVHKGTRRVDHAATRVLPVQESGTTIYPSPIRDGLGRVLSRLHTPLHL